MSDMTAFSQQQQQQLQLQQQQQQSQQQQQQAQQQLSPLGNPLPTSNPGNTLLTLLQANARTTPGPQVCHHAHPVCLVEELAIASILHFILLSNCTHL